jgi:hypothetical protein
MGASEPRWSWLAKIKTLLFAADQLRRPWNRLAMPTVSAAHWVGISAGMCKLRKPLTPGYKFNIGSITRTSTRRQDSANIGLVPNRSEPPIKQRRSPHHAGLGAAGSCRCANQNFQRRQTDV